MSQVSLRDIEIIGLKIWLMQSRRKKTRGKHWKKNKELMDKNENLMKQIIFQLLVQGARHILWDMFISEATKIIP